MKKHHFHFLLLGLLTAAWGHSEEKQAALSPVDTTKAFFLAMENRDEGKIRELALPNPKLSTLWTERFNDEGKAELERVIHDDLRILKAGECVPMEGQKMVIPAQFCTDTLVLVYGKEMRYPFPLHLINGVWRVNTGPLLAARAKALRMK